MYSANADLDQSATLEDYLRAVGRYRWLILAVTIAGLVLGLFFANQRIPVYSASARVVLGPSPVGSTIDGRLIEPNLEKERELFASFDIANAVSERMVDGPGPDELLRKLEVQFVPDSDVMRISYESADPQEAADVVNGFAEVYVDARTQNAALFYATRIESLQEELLALQREIAADEAEVASILEQRAVASLDPAQSASLVSFDEARTTLRTTILENRRQERTIDGEIGDLEAQAAVGEDAATILRIAEAPNSPGGLSKNVLVGVGTFLGLIVGLVSTFLLERLDSTARDEDAVTFAVGAGVLGLIPKFGIRRRKGQAALIMSSAEHTPRLSIVRESFRRLRTSIQFLGNSSEARKILITSAYPGEGKSVVTANLGVALANGGKKVAIVSADLRRPTVEAILGVTATQGLSDILTNAEGLELSPAPSVENLWLVAAGPPPANPGELLGSERFGLILDELPRTVDFVLIDTPPVLSTADAAIAAAHCDGVLLVVNTGKTEVHDLERVRADLNRAGAEILGTVLNRVSQRNGSLGRGDKYAYTTTTK